MCKKMLSTKTVLSFLLVAFCLTLNLPTTDASECRIIRLLGGSTQSKQKVRIEPSTMWIQKGTCVIWYNWTKSGEVKITFQKTKKQKYKDFLKSPMGFEVSAKAFTARIPHGGTSSMRFVETGTYSYEVGTIGGAKQSGQIVVIDYTVD